MSARAGADGGAARIRGAIGAAADEGRSALITYLMLGYPSPEDSMMLVPALQAGGADVIELGVPFSDPVADGPTIQRAGQAALQQGVTPRDCLRLVARLRGEAGVTVPLVLMGYYNPIHSYGFEAYVDACAEVGVDGLIVPDLPPEEASPLREACLQRGLALILLVAPTTELSRAVAISGLTSGFLYVVSRLGITGTALDPGEELRQRLERLRTSVDVPIAVGFGISTPEQAHALAGLADGIIVGSAIVDRATVGAAEVRAFVSSLQQSLRHDRSRPA
jgi:tryptophan synthase alpha chain